MKTIMSKIRNLFSTKNQWTEIVLYHNDGKIEKHFMIATDGSYRYTLDPNKPITGFAVKGPNSKVIV